MKQQPESTWFHDPHWMPYRVIRQDEVEGHDPFYGFLAMGNLEFSIQNLWTALWCNYASSAVYSLKKEEKNEESLVPISFGPGIYKKGEFPGSRIKEIHRPSWE
jgi:hypothetical protein